MVLIGTASTLLRLSVEPQTNGGIYLTELMIRDPFPVCLFK